MPWKIGDGVCASDGNECRAPSRGEGRTSSRKDGDVPGIQFGLRSINADPSAPLPTSATAARCQNIKGASKSGVHITPSRVDEPGGYAAGSSGGGEVEVERCASGSNAFRKDAEIEMALRGVLDALRRVREERLR